MNCQIAHQSLYFLQFVLYSRAIWVPFRPVLTVYSWLLMAFIRHFSYFAQGIYAQKRKKSRICDHSSRPAFELHIRYHTWLRLLCARDIGTKKRKSRVCDHNCRPTFEHRIGYHTWFRLLCTRDMRITILAAVNQPFWTKKRGVSLPNVSDISLFEPKKGCVGAKCFRILPLLSPKRGVYRC